MGTARQQLRTDRFSFDGDDNTTSFTLPQEPDGKGTLVWVAYNGQYQHQNTHFTIAGRTMTMTFTPASGSKIDGFLIRMI